MSFDARATLIGLLEGMNSSTWMKPSESKREGMLAQLRLDAQPSDEPVPEKLVRNEPGRRIRSEGLPVRVAGPYEMPPLLARKLVEEAREVFAAIASSAVRSQLVEELADVAEVMTALCAELQIEADEVNHARINKRINQGSFSERLVAQVRE